MDSVGESSAAAVRTAPTSTQLSVPSGVIPTVSAPVPTTSETAAIVGSSEAPRRRVGFVRWCTAQGVRCR